MPFVAPRSPQNQTFRQICLFRTLPLPFLDIKNWFLVFEIAMIPCNNLGRK